MNPTNWIAEGTAAKPSMYFQPSGSTLEKAPQTQEAEKSQCENLGFLTLSFYVKSILVKSNFDNVRGSRF